MWQNQWTKPGIPYLGPVPLSAYPFKPLDPWLPSWAQLWGETWASVDFKVPRWFPMCSHVFDGETFLKLGFMGSSTTCLCSVAVIYMKSKRFGMKFWSKQLPIYAFSVKVVWGVAVREIELSETNIRIIREYFFFIGHPRWIAGKIKF